MQNDKALESLLHPLSVIPMLVSRDITTKGGGDTKKVSFDPKLFNHYTFAATALPSLLPSCNYMYGNHTTRINSHAAYCMWRCASAVLSSAQGFPSFPKVSSLMPSLHPTILRQYLTTRLLLLLNVY